MLRQKNLFMQAHYLVCALALVATLKLIYQYKNKIVIVKSQWNLILTQRTISNRGKLGVGVVVFPGKNLPIGCPAPNSQL